MKVMERLGNTLNWASSRLTIERDKRISKCKEVGSIIYFVSAGPFLKVGISSKKSFKGRLNTFQVSNAFKIKVLKMLETTNPIEDEEEFHTALNEFHVKGEWFLIPPSHGIMQFLTGARGL